MSEMYYKGRPVEEMTREELLAAFVRVCRDYQSVMEGPPLARYLPEGTKIDPVGATPRELRLYGGRVIR